MRVVESIDDEDFDELVDQVLRQLNVFCSGGSGWVLEKLIWLDIKICKTKSLAGSSYLPKPAKRSSLRRSLLNIKNLFDNFCFIYCILAFLYPCRQNRERPSMYKDEFNRLIFDKSAMRMKLSDIAQFENKNQLSITVFNFDEKGSLTCCHRSKVKSKIGKVFLLLLTDVLNSHYCLITNFQHFMHTLCRSPRKAMKCPKTKFCVNCMQSIGKVEYRDHVRRCEDNQPLRNVLPNEDLKLKFNNWEKTEKCPFVVYADLEALNVPADIKNGKRLLLLKNNIPQATVLFWLIVEPTLWLQNPSIVAKTASVK